MSLTGKVALVTGANSGIGRAIALALGREGCRVAVNYVVQPEAAEAVVQEIRGFGAKAMAVRADVADEEQVRAMMAEVVGRWGGLSILVNNAGIQNTVPFAEMPVSVWDEMIAVHLRGTFLCCRFAVPEMLRAGGGHIVNIASQLGQIGRAQMVHYSAAKAGIIGLTRALARELAPTILVNAVAPGPIAVGPTIATPEERQRYMDSLPLRRFGTAEEVAAAVCFLVSGQADYFCGQVLGPNGGEVMS